PADTMAAILNETPADLASSGRNIAPALDRIVRRCLEKAPHQRFQTAQELVTALEESSFPSAESFAHSPPGKTPSTPRSISVSRPTPTPSSRRVAPEAERRQVTLLVCGCGVFDSDDYLELDAEDQARLLQGFQQACDRAATRFDGTIVQCDEHGLM